MVRILFHTDDVKIYKKDIRHYKKPAKMVLPVGCLVSTNARNIHIQGVKNINYQAILVLVGDWPITPQHNLYDWRGVEYIRSKDQFLDWKSSMGGNWKPPGPKKLWTRLRQPAV